MNLEEALNYRRAVRVFDKNKPLDPEKVKRCLELAALATCSYGNSSKSPFLN